MAMPSRYTASIAFWTTRWVCRSRSGTKERRLGPEHPSAHGADMDADLDGEYDGVIQVHGDGYASGVPEPRRRAATALAFNARKAPPHLAKRARGGLDGCLTGLHGRGPSTGLQPGGEGPIPMSL